MPAKRPPIPLSRERIIESALHIADSQGLRRLTMRRLGDALQVEAMAIYHHLPRGKDALMDALAEHVTTVHAEPADTWQETARAWCRASREALREHPGVLALALTKQPKGRAAMAIREQAEQLAEAGLENAPEAVRALRAYVLGAVAVEVQQSGWAEPSGDGDEPWRPPSQGGGSAAADADFERGLNALLTGLES
ncbi:TetR/AcrR family transcriptional regulator C-terminal domain-containing protein [Planobispora longispora]|uniref:Putative transcriptional regulator, TetR family protein n=1 Tax=Planobispora longispora TaxID=28887 RepID=A0A8J3RSN7_9ACTN|nr:TetR/AcrR family transcriptional regulator C-terminal domain-containing protein [Planobispora longispora]BFE78977.1 TetR/AcrR family transcriptional regulator C-terminal domain-containing protein [Planobispora longispora]GIH80489.1 putative transcriptional regulator, TetR family protein [Planobispora longispora]